LFDGVLREIEAHVLAHGDLELLDQFLQVIGGQFSIHLVALAVLVSFQRVFKGFVSNAEDDGAEHLDEAAV